MHGKLEFPSGNSSLCVSAFTRFSFPGFELAVLSVFEL
jgi:hypothetical protein